MLPDFPYRHTIQLALYGLAVAAPLLHAGYRIVWTAASRLTVTTQRVETAVGVFRRVTRDVELYRVLHTETIQPLHYRLIGRGTVCGWHRDAAPAAFTLAGIQQPETVRQTIRALVEDARSAYGVHVVE